MWELDYKESWVLKNWCFWTVVLEKTLESPLDCKQIQSVSPKANQSWIFIGRTDAEAEAPVLWLPDVKNWLIGKDPDAGKDLRQEEKGTTEDEMVWWYHWLHGHEFEQTPWRIGRPGVLQSIGPQRVGHNLATEQQTWIRTNDLIAWIKKLHGGNLLWRRGLKGTPANFITTHGAYLHPDPNILLNANKSFLIIISCWKFEHHMFNVINNDNSIMTMNATM